MNILSEPFDSWVKEQVEVRQKSLGKFGNIPENDLLAYNTKAPFLRLASSINLTNKGSEGNILDNSVLKKLIAAGFREEEISGDQLSKNCTTWHITKYYRSYCVSLIIISGTIFFRILFFGLRTILYY